MSNQAQSFLTTLAGLVTPQNLAAVTNLVGTTFSSTLATQADPILASLQTKQDVPAVAAALIEKLEELPNMPDQVIKLLEALREVKDPLQWQQYIVTIKGIVDGAGSNLATSLTRVRFTVPAA